MKIIREVAVFIRSIYSKIIERFPSRGIKRRTRVGAADPKIQKEDAQGLGPPSF